MSPHTVAEVNSSFRPFFKSTQFSSSEDNQLDNIVTDNSQQSDDSESSFQHGQQISDDPLSWNMNSEYQAKSHDVFYTELGQHGL